MGWRVVAGIGDAGLLGNQGSMLSKGSENRHIWQEEFFDHILRSSETYGQKWDYVKKNPVRANLFENSEQWPWQGEIESLRF